MNQRKKTISTLFWVRKSRANGGKAPLFCRVTICRQRYEMPLNLAIDPKLWNAKLQLCTGKTPAAKDINRIIREQTDVVNAAIDKLQAKGYPLSIENFKLIYRAVDNDFSTIDKLFDYFLATGGNKLRPSTLKSYTATRRHLAAFVMLRYHISDFDITAIDRNFVNEFYAYLQGYLRQDNKRQCTENGALKHMQRFRKLLDMACSNEWIARNPADGMHWEKRKTERGFLTEEELKRIADAQLTPALSVLRDIFLFSVYTGTSFVDMTMLTDNNIVVGIDHSLWLNFNRTKTGQRCSIPLLEPALRILDRYENYRRASPQARLFPVPTNQVTNRDLKIIARAAHVDKNITFHCARHTFATTITLSNGIPLETVSRMLGHASIATTQIYAKIVDKKVLDDMAQLRNRYATENVCLKQKSNK